MPNLNADRILRCSVRPDQKIAIFYKPDQTTPLRAFIVTKEDLRNIVKKCQNKKDPTDPYFDGYEMAKILGLFSIEGSKQTIQKIIKTMEKLKLEVE